MASRTSRLSDPARVDEAVLARLVAAENARGGCMKQRWVFAILALTGLMCVYAMRVNLSVAALPMQQQLNWGEATTGYILASFFVGYLPFQIPGGLLAKKWNAHAVFGLGVAATSIFTLLLPLAATGTLGGTGSIGLWGNVPIMLLRCLMGAGESVTFPALYALFQQWIPRDERSSIVSFVRAGAPLGTILSFPVSSLLCSTLKSCPAGVPTAAPTQLPTEAPTSALASALLSGAALATGSDPDAALCSHCINGESVFGLCSWSLVFYVFGALGCVWTVLWFSLTTNRPSDGRRCLAVAKEEVALIEYTNIALHAAARRSSANADDGPFEVDTASSNSQVEVTQRMRGASCCEGRSAQECCRTPWLALITHPAAYAIYISHFSMNWALYTFLTELPKFLKQRLDFDIKKAGVVEVLPYAAMFFTSLVGGKLCDALIRALSTPRIAACLRACVPAPLARWTGTLTPRRIARTLFQGIGSMVPAVVLLFIPSAQSSTAGVALMTVAIGFTGFAYSGYAANPLDIASASASTLFSLSNTLATVPGIVSPALTGHLLEAACVVDATAAIAGQCTAASVLSGWRSVFIIASAVYAVGFAAWLLLMRGEQQAALNWNDERACQRAACSSAGASMVDADANPPPLFDLDPSLAASLLGEARDSARSAKERERSGSAVG